MYLATANVVLPTTIIGSLPRPGWYTQNLGRHEAGTPAERGNAGNR